MRVVYPQPGHQTYEAATFLMGQAPAGATLTINDAPVSTSESGFFSHYAPLDAGDNHFTLTAENTSEAATVFRHPPLKILPGQPLAVHEETMTPHRNVTLMPGDTLSVSLSASVGEGVAAFIIIPGIADEPVPLEQPFSDEDGYLDNREAVFAEYHQTRPLVPKRGYYEATITIPAEAAECHHVPVILTMTDGEGKLDREFPGRVSIWRAPRIGRVTHQRAVTLSLPEKGAWLSPLPEGTRLTLTGASGDWYRCRLSAGRHLWVHHDNVALPETASSRLPSLCAIRTERLDAYSARLVVPLSDRPPVQVTAGQGRLILSLSDTRNHCNFIRFDAQNPIIRDARQQEIDDTTSEIALAVPGLCGYHYGYTEEGLVLTVRILPQDPAEIRILIDAGHGGEESGAIGLDGIPEKERNLIVANRLVFALQELGFQTRQTRLGDQTVSLDERIRIAAEFNPHISLSIHHNALPDGRRPEDHRGVCTLFCHPFARPLAENIQESVAIATALPGEGLYYDSLFMTRLHEGMAVLIELGYFTHPEDFERIARPEFVDMAVEGILTGVCRTLGFELADV